MTEHRRRKTFFHLVVGYGVYEQIILSVKLSEYRLVNIVRVHVHVLCFARTGFVLFAGRKHKHAYVAVGRATYAPHLAAQKRALTLNLLHNALGAQPLERSAHGSQTHVELAAVFLFRQKIAVFFQLSVFYVAQYPFVHIFVCKALIYHVPFFRYL